MLYSGPTSASQPRGHKVEWRLPQWAYDRFLELTDQLAVTAPDTHDHQALQEQVRALPNFPRYYDPDRDVIVLQVTTVRS